MIDKTQLNPTSLQKVSVMLIIIVKIAVCALRVYDAHFYDCELFLSMPSSHACLKMAGSGCLNGVLNNSIRSSK